ncbi:ferrous iron transporter B [Eubacterium sp. CAG:161]|uniref:ferrous iron transporter B n=1 Tax=Eubacterium sp. CAG:161 TaxID=1262881 RepID=UPI0003376833|nr:ferrous iron transporter B [Eubacterium sp. CAG:161]CCY68482.1 ferrous iron transport protein B [Eubacterium sp. CAG:161]
MSIKIALAGNPNSGKTTLFNALTGSNQFVGNWPGVTVEKKEGKLKGHKDVALMDLPGIYSLSPYTLEEVVARNYLINERPDAIINIVDGTNIERNLYLSTQIMELGIPVIMAVNMLDVLEKRGDKIHINKLSEKLGCEVVEISALKGTGIRDLANKAVKLAESKKKNIVVHKFANEVEEVIDETKGLLSADIPEEQKRFFAIKLLERDEKIREIMRTVPDVSKQIDKLEKAFDDDTESIITNERYVYISSIIKDCVTKAKSDKLTASDKIDRIVTNRILALPIFAVVMCIVYYISVTTVGTWATDWTNDGVFGDGFHLFGIGTAQYEKDLDKWADENVFSTELEQIAEKAVKENVAGAEEVKDAIADKDFGAFEEAYGSYNDAFDEKGLNMDEALGDAIDEEGEFTGPDTSEYGVWVPGIPVLVGNGLEAIHCNDFLTGLIIDGIIAGVGAVLGFVPQMLVLFIFLAFLESCGYMSRVAFIMDRIFRKFGLSGKAFIPILIGTGCGVPGLMATRTIENDRDRKMSLMTTTFIPCGAKLPIIALIAAALFNGAWWVAPSAYFLGMFAIITSGIILKKTKLFAGEPAPFVMELPAYHWPTVGTVLRSMWERGWSFIKKAGTIILLSSIVVWLGSHFGNTGSGFGYSSDMELADSVLGSIGNVVKWIFAPLGFNDATATVATIMGLVAKEEVVGVFGVLDFEGMLPVAGYAFLAFNLLCAPCFAAMGAIKREMNNSKWFWIAIGYMTCFAYLTALVIYQIGGLIVGETGFGIFTIIAILVVIGFLYLLFRPSKENN